MQQILAYADSLSWRIIPTTRQRLPFEQRWQGVMEIALCSSGKKVRVIDDRLNGRRTVWDDPFKLTLPRFHVHQIVGMGTEGHPGQRSCGRFRFSASAGAERFDVPETDRRGSHGPRCPVPAAQFSL